MSEGWERGFLFLFSKNLTLQGGEVKLKEDFLGADFGNRKIYK